MCSREWTTADTVTRHSGTVWADCEPWEEDPRGIMSIGGTAAGAIMAPDKYSSPFIVQRKLKDGFTVKKNSAMERGLFYERLAQDGFRAIFKHSGDDEKLRGYKLLLTPGMYYREECKWQIAHLDGVLHNSETGDIILVEIKSSSVAAGWEENKVPDKYYWQVMWYLHVMNMKRAVIISFLPSLEVKVGWIDRDINDIQTMTAQIHEFYQRYIEGDEQAPLLGSEVEVDAAKEAHEKSPLPVDSQSLESIGVEYIEISDEIRRLERIKKELQARAYMALGGAWEHKDKFASFKVIESERFTVNARTIHASYPDIFSAHGKISKSTSLRIQKNKE